MSIKHFDSGPRLSRMVTYGGIAYLAGLTADDTSAGVKGQTAQILEKIDHYLKESGTSKSNLLTANLWIKDMAMFADMNSVWNAWVDPENPPARACVKADLARPEVLVEQVVPDQPPRDGEDDRAHERVGGDGEGDAGLPDTAQVQRGQDRDQHQ